VTALTPGMRIEVVATFTVVPAEGPPEAIGFIPYTGPGTWQLYGFTGDGKLGPGKTWIDCRLCNECAADPVKVEPVREKVKVNLRIDTAGDFIAATNQLSGSSCQACRRTEEGRLR
jgi:hypothetical protein